jgi:hypothetical protein
MPVERPMTFRFTSDPAMHSEHEHLWAERLRSHRTASTATKTERHGGLWKVGPETRMYYCGSCHVEFAWEPVAPGERLVVYSPETFLHTCSVCEEQYRDGSPFSERCPAMRKACSPQCADRIKRELRAEGLSSFIPSLEGMIRNATNEAVRLRALERLRLIATDEGEPFCSMARAALARLGQ